MYEYSTFIISESINNKKLVLTELAHTWLILSHRSVSGAKPSIYYVSSFVNNIYIVQPVLAGDVTYQVDGVSKNKLNISISGNGILHVLILHRGIKHTNPHPYIE